jgi:hypothetical protein
MKRLNDLMSMVDVPEGEKGDWKIERFIISEYESKLEALRSQLSSSAMGRGVLKAGTYTRLIYKGKVIMSDTPDELRDCFPFVWNAKGMVLINGLGMGVVLESLLRKPEVTHIVVIEIDKDVIDLVAEHYQKKAIAAGIKLEIIHADVFTWKNTNRYKFDAIWHDIWPNICADNLVTMKRLHRRGGHWLVNNDSYQMSWCRHLCERGCKV